MFWFIPGEICCILLALTFNVHAAESVWHSDRIQFVPVHANHIGPVVTLGQDASADELHDAIAESCNISFPFELHLTGNIIASSRSLTNQALKGIPSIVSMARDLDEIYGPGFRIPLRMHRLIQSEQDFTVFASLARMFGGSRSNIHEFEWYRLVLRCLQSQSCDSKMICERFKKLFLCEGDTINLMALEAQYIRGHLDLSATPRAVKAINLKKNLLTRITGLNQLAGKQLKFLDIRRNPLEIDLKELQSTPQMTETESSPLKVLRVNYNQISQSLIGKYQTKKGTLCEELHQAAIKWIESSTLDAIVIGRRAKYIERTSVNRVDV